MSVELLEGHLVGFPGVFCHPIEWYTAARQNVHKFRQNVNARFSGERLAPVEVPDGSTLFNVAQRLGASVGIALLSTFFIVREQARVNDTLIVYGQHVNLTWMKLSPTLAAKLAQAAVDGFHDTVWLLIGLSAFGILLALLLHDAPHFSAEKIISTKDVSVPADATWQRE